MIVTTCGFYDCCVTGLAYLTEPILMLPHLNMVDEYETNYFENLMIIDFDLSFFLCFSRVLLSTAQRQ